MKKISLYALAIGIACWTGAALTSCSTFGLGPDEVETGDGPYISLTFGMAATDAEGNPALTPVEQRMRTVDLFFYPANGTDGRPVKTHHIENTTHDTKHTVSISDAEFAALFGGDKTENHTCVVYSVVNVSEEDFAASGISDKNAATPADLKKIKARTPSFAAEFKGGLAMFSSKETGDVITYDATSKKATGTIHLKNLAAKIDLLVNFGTDIAGVDPNDSSKGSQTWNVATNGNNPTAEVHILNGVMAVRLDGSMPELAEEDYYSIRFDNEEHIRTVAPLDDKDPAFGYNGKTWYATSAPYYSYPNVWEDSPLEQHRTSLLLKVDWTVQPDPETAGPADLLTTYYNVPLALDANKLESNKYYRVKVNINTLGGQNFGEPLELEASVEVLDWGHAELEADLRELRYLEVSQTQLDRDGLIYTAVINGNDGLVTIPFKSSHKVMIRDINIEWYSYDNFDDNGKEGDRDWYIFYPGNRHVFAPAATTFTKTRQELDSNNWHCAYIDNVNHTITVKHNIGVTTSSGSSYYYPNRGENDINTYYSYLITIVLQHENWDEHFELETITIMHHPPIYIEGEVNEVINDTDWDWNSGGNASKDRTATTNISTKYHWGWARVNGNDPTADRNTNYGGLRGIAKNDRAGGNIGDRSSKNPVMYIINVTSLEEGSVFHIRDPRVTTNQAGSIGGNWTAAPHYLNGVFEETSNAHTLTEYYPTDESTVNEMKYALSPRYRVASSFGQTGGSGNNPREISRDDAKRRCASYCEYGYPAGRWRLPTLGEIKYIQVLSNRGLIPRIFNVGVDYICAQGIFTFNNAGDETEKVGANNAYVRCVYDDWYWVKEDGSPDKIDDPYNALPNHQIFVWGDKPKNNPQVQPQEN